MSDPCRVTHNVNGIWTETAPQCVTLRPRRVRRGGVIAQQTRLIWSPAPENAPFCRGDRTIEFAVNLLPDGQRRLVYQGGYEVYVQDAWLAGLAIGQQRGLSPEYVHSYRFMKLVFDRMRAGHEHRKRRFATEQDLVVRRSGRGGQVEGSLLPEYVGWNASGAGRTWSVYRLMQQGRALAAELKIPQPKEPHFVACGIMAAAQRNPLTELTDREVDGLMFQALFDVGDLPMSVAESVVDDVLDRLCEAIQEHGDDAWGAFSRWFAGAKSNLVQTLARKAGHPELSREQVKAALLRIGWRSYQYVRDCLGTFAQAAAMSLEVPLDEQERRYFDDMYFPQAHFGGLPLVLLFERGSLVEPILSQMWTRPDDVSLVGVLHRMLSIYADMAGGRRVADRRFKSLRRANGEQAYEVNDDNALHGVVVDSRIAVRFSEVAGSLLERTKRGCGHCIDAAHWQITGRSETSGRIRLTVDCARHDFSADYVVTIDELQREERLLRADSE